MSCPDCFRGGAATGTPGGKFKTIHNVNTYIASPTETANHTLPSSVIVLYTDAFGHNLVNNKLLADAISTKTGLTVLVPDIIPGGGMSPAILPLMDTFVSATASALSKAWAIDRAMVHVIPFFMRASSQSEKCTVPCVEYARGVRAGLPADTKLGLAGYCWGGYQALYVAKQEALVDAVFVAHPARFEAVQVKEAVGNGVKLSFAHAGEDMSLPMLEIEETRKVVGEGQTFEMRVYDGGVHGFAVRATPGKEKEKTAADEAVVQVTSWLKKWL